MRNLRHLATAITQQKLAYEFPYSSFELDTDLNFVLLSEGKAILPVGPNFLLNTNEDLTRLFYHFRLIASSTFDPPRRRDSRCGPTRASSTSSGATSPR